MHGFGILCGISKGTFEIPHKISYPSIERCDFYPLAFQAEGVLSLLACVRPSVNFTLSAR